VAKKESLNAWTDKFIKDMQRANAANATSSRFRDADVSGSKYNVTPAVQEGNTDPGVVSRIFDVLSRGVYAGANTATHVIRDAKGEANTSANPADAFWRGLSGQDKTSFATVADELLPKDVGDTGNTLSEEISGRGFNPELVKKVQDSEAGKENYGSGTRRALVAAAGFAGDVALDPINLISGGTIGAVSKGAKAIRGLSAGERALQESRLLRDVARTDAARNAAPRDIKSVIDAVDGTAKIPTPANTDVIAPVRDYTKDIELNGFTPEQYHKVADDVIRLGGSVTPSQIARISGVRYGEAGRIFKQLEADGILGPKVRKTGQPARVNLAQPVVATAKPAGLWGEDVVNQAKKVDEAAVVANAAAPTEIVPLPVENIPTSPKQNYDLTPKGQGILGSKAIGDALKSLVEADTGKPLYKPGVERAQALRAEALPAWKAAVEADAAAGAKPVLYSADNTPYVLSIPHVLERLPENVVDDMVFGASWGRYSRNANLYHTQIGRGMAEALRVDDLGLPLVDRYKQVMDAIKKAMPPAAARKRLAVPARQMAESAKALVDNTDAIREAQYELTKTLLKKDLQDAADLAKNASTEVMASVTNPHVPKSDTFKVLTNTGTEIMRSAREIGASQNAASIAAKEAATIIAKVAPEADTSAARAALAVKRERIAGSPDAKVSARVQNHLKVVEKESDDLLGVPVVELGVRADNRLNGILEHIFHPVRSKMAFGYGFQAFKDDFRATAVERTARNVVNYNRWLNKTLKVHGRGNFDTAFSAIKREVPPVEEGAAAASSEVNRLVNHMFDVKEPFIGALWRTGAGIKQINKAMKMQKVGFEFKEGAKGEIVADQWKTWDIKDPADFLAKMNAALTNLAGKQAFGTGFSHNFGVSTPRPGYVRITSKDTDILGDFIDKTKFYPREYAEEMTRLENMLTQPANFRGTNIIGDQVKTPEGIVAGIVNNFIDPIMQIWKPFMTILRPGHHIRNFFSDIMFSMLDGVYSIGSYRKGLKMMQAGGALRGEGIDGLKAIEAGASINGGSKMSTIRLRGRNVDLTYDNGYILANKHGLLPAGHAIEDLESTSKGIDKFQNSLPMRAASRVSEESGGFTRLAHFSNLMERKSFTRKFDTLDEAAEAAAAQVKRYHPDVHGLSPAERKYARRIIPFYSWIRQALPVVLNTMITKPGRVTLINKAQYNTAIAMGLNPDSLSDPFPTDKLYPSFVTAHITGPWAGDKTFNLGSPGETLSDLFNKGEGEDQTAPLRRLLGQVNPLLKAPVELATSTDIASGRPIVDTGEYVDRQLPVVNQVAGISGYSPTGTVAAILRGLPVPDPQRAVARGEKQHLFNESLVNFLTGLGIQSVDKGSYQRIALKEQADG